MPVRGSGIGAMKGALGGVSRGATSQPPPPAGNPSQNSFSANMRMGRGGAPGIGPRGGYRFRGAGGNLTPTVKWLIALVVIEIVGGEVVHRMFGHHYGSPL